MLNAKVINTRYLSQHLTVCSLAQKNCFINDANKGKSTNRENIDSATARMSRPDVDMSNLF